MEYSTLKCTEFVEVLASKEPVPGGGGASALVGAIGTALCSMVGNLTVGKKKYAAVEEEMLELMQQTSHLQRDVLAHQCHQNGINEFPIGADGGRVDLSL